jgi:2-polyprenyl-6-methoxyphenol hydroxylase-like FAD-dependent oxidoreductase
MNVGIVGGSIAGCSAAILLLKEGHEVTIFERSGKALVGRGGGIGTTTSLMDEIKQDGLIGSGFAHFSINKMPLIGKSESSEPLGKTAWSIPMEFQVFQWNELWRSLRQNVPNKNYKSGIKITGAEMLETEQVRLFTNSGKNYDFDLVLFADGYSSLGRNILFPDVKLQYRGYVLWRGLLPENKMTGMTLLKAEILRLSYQGEPGHNVVYYIPNQNGSTLQGERVFNWAAYIAVSESELESVLKDKNGEVRDGTVPPGFLSLNTENKLKKFLSKNIPKYYADIVLNTKDSYLQVIYTVDLDGYYKEHMALIGDAGIVVQPFTGSGVFKGYNNVKDLIQCLKDETSLKNALDKWSKKQLQTGKKLLALGEQMEKAFIWEQLDFAQVDEETTKKWWKDSVTFPDNFNYKEG